MASRRSGDGDGIIAGMGCLFILLNVAWVAFVVWVIIVLVKWLTRQTL